MTLRRPLLAALAFVALFVVYLWDVDRTERQRLRALQEDQVLFQNPDLVTRLAFEDEAGARVVLVRPGGKGDPWKVQEPRSVDADQTTIDAYLENLRGARRQARFESDDAATYGLEKPRRRVSVTWKDGEKAVEETLEFGLQPEQFGRVYARLASRPTEVFTVSEWLFRQSSKSFGDVRDRSLLGRELAASTRFDVRSRREAFHLLRPNASSNEWTLQMEGAAPLPADRTLLDRLQGQLPKASFLEVSDGWTSTTQQLGLEPPAVTLSADGLVLLEVGARVPERDQFFARRADGTLGIVARSLVTDLFRPAPEWGTKRFVWIPRDEIVQLESRSGTTSMNLLRQKDGSWIFAEMPGVAVHSERLEAFLEALTALSAVQIVQRSPSAEDLQGHGILDGTYRVSVQDAAGRTQGFAFGRTDSKEGRTFVHRLQDNTLWAMDFRLQADVFKFRRDFEDRRLLAGLAARTDRFEVESQGNVMGLAKKSGAWEVSLPGERPTLLAPPKVDAFLTAFEDLETDVEFTPMRQQKPAMSFRFFAGASTPSASAAILGKLGEKVLMQVNDKFYEVAEADYQTIEKALIELTVLSKSTAQETKP